MVPSYRFLSSVSTVENIVIGSSCLVHLNWRLGRCSLTDLKLYTGARCAREELARVRNPGCELKEPCLEVDGGVMILLVKDEKGPRAHHDAMRCISLLCVC